jgi:predicted HAD superfamily hydrolase
LYDCYDMKNKYWIGQLVYIAKGGFVLQTKIEAVLCDPNGENCAYYYAGKKDADVLAWEHQIYTEFEPAAQRARLQAQYD